MSNPAGPFCTSDRICQYAVGIAGGTATGALYGWAVTPLGAAAGAVMGLTSTLAGHALDTGIMVGARSVQAGERPSDQCTVALYVSLVALGLIAGVFASAGVVLAAGYVSTFSAALSFTAPYHGIYAGLNLLLGGCGLCCIPVRIIGNCRQTIFA